MNLKIDKTTIVYIVIITLIAIVITTIANIDMLVNYNQMTNLLMFYLSFLNVLTLNLLIIAVPIVKIGLSNSKQESQ